MQCRLRLDQRTIRISFRASPSRPVKGGGGSEGLIDDGYQIANRNRPTRSPSGDRREITTSDVTVRLSGDQRTKEGRKEVIGAWRMLKGVDFEMDGRRPSEAMTKTGSNFRRNDRKSVLVFRRRVSSRSKLASLGKIIGAHL